MPPDAPRNRALPKWLFIALLSGGFLILGLGVLLLAPALASARWPTTQGIVLSARVVEQPQGKSLVYSIAITYRYEANGQRYEGRTFSHSSDSLPLSGKDRDKVHNEYQTSPTYAAWQPTKTVTVFYDPKNPAHSVLRPGATALGWFVSLLGLIITGIGTWEGRRIRRLDSAS